MAINIFRKPTIQLTCTDLRTKLPIDVIPKFIPGVEFVDNTFVIGMVMKCISDEIARYKKFKGM
jgi:hypothetical protein